MLFIETVKFGSDIVIWVLRMLSIETVKFGSDIVIWVLRMLFMMEQTGAPLRVRFCSCCK